jgi:hypothetical protein
MTAPLGKLAIVFAAWTLTGGVDARSQTIATAVHREAVPAELAAEIAAALAAGGTRMTVGAATIDCWWVKAVAGGQGPSTASSAWQSVPEGALIGVMRSTAPLRDIRGRTIPPGTYTLRFGLQPANGDHLGVSPHREFLLVSPARVDTTVAPTGHDRTVDLSRETINASHPSVLSLDPPESSLAPGSIHRNDAGHEAVIVEVVRGEGTPLRFGIVLVGKIEA